MKRVCMFLVAAFLLPTASHSQQNPLIGSWKQNVTMSKYETGQPVQSNTYTITSSGANGLSVTQDRTNAGGSNDHIQFTANFDGKDYPVTGYTDGRALVSIKRITPNSFRLTYKNKQGEAVEIHPWVVSPDGKTLSTAVSNVGANGQLGHRLVIFDKQ
jgi:hypothetical protein